MRSPVLSAASISLERTLSWIAPALPVSGSLTFVNHRMCDVARHRGGLRVASLSTSDLQAETERSSDECTNELRGEALEVAIPAQYACEHEAHASRYQNERGCSFGEVGGSLDRPKQPSD